MIVSELRRYLVEHHRATLAELARRFDAEPEAVRGMLAALARSGRVKMLPAHPGCGGGCCKCAPETLEVWEWTAPTAP